MSVGAAPVIPPEVLDEEREKLRKQLEMERTKSRVLYERAYQAYLVGQQATPHEKEDEQPVSEPEFLSKVKKAYEEAYALRAFRDVMEGDPRAVNVSQRSLPNQSENIATNLMKSGVPPELVSKWMKDLDPEALGAMIALQSNNPMLAMMSFAMSQRKEQLGIKDIIDINNAISKSNMQPNISLDIPKLIEAVKAQPPSASPTDVLKTTLEAIQAGMAMAGGGKSEEPKSHGVLETLLGTPEGVRTAKEIGLIGGEATSLQIISEMRKNDAEARVREKESDRRWELRLEQQHASTQLELAKINESRHRTNMIGESFKKIGSAIADGLTNATEEGEGKEKDEEEAEEEGGLRQMTCPECQTLIVIPPEAKVGDHVRCAKCKNEYELTREGK